MLVLTERGSHCTYYEARDGHQAVAVSIADGSFPFAGAAVAAWLLVRSRRAGVLGRGAGAASGGQGRWAGCRRRQGGASGDPACNGGGMTSRNACSLLRETRDERTCITPVPLAARIVLARACSALIASSASLMSERRMDDRMRRAARGVHLSPPRPPHPLHRPAAATTQPAAAARAFAVRPRMLRGFPRAAARAMASSTARKPPLRGVVCDMDGAWGAGCSARGARSSSGASGLGGKSLAPLGPPARAPSPQRR